MTPKEEKQTLSQFSNEKATSMPLIDAKHRYSLGRFDRESGRLIDFLTAECLTFQEAEAKAKELQRNGINAKILAPGFQRCPPPTLCFLKNPRLPGQ